MLHGIANIGADQESASYWPNYHAPSDTYEEGDTLQLMSGEKSLQFSIAGSTF